MGIINVLDKDSASKIAAGEVVENAASAIKELVENSIDAGAKHITVEIKEGGKSYIRVTDDGSGMSYEDAEKAFLRHATSKIRSIDDLSYLSTMGFRGEALAALSAVSKITLYTKRPEDTLGSELVIEGGKIISHEESGQKDGTTVIVKNLFYNTPARLKFLKRDATEAGYVSYIVEREAIARPDISFTFIKDGEEKFFTDGKGSLLSAISSIFGRQVAESLLKVSADIGGVKVEGFVSRPLAAKASRDLELFYVNGRFIKNKTLSAALEGAYANELMTKRFPVCFLKLDISPSEIDINVSPSKTEIKFSQNVSVFDSIYFSVKNVLANESGREVIEIPEKKEENEFEALINSIASSITETAKPEAPKDWKIEKRVTVLKEEKAPETKPFVPFQTDFSLADVTVSKDFAEKEENCVPKNEIKDLPSFKEIKTPVDLPVSAADNEPQNENVIIKGEIFNSYILVENGDELMIIDKHAAHERMLFEKLKSGASELTSQYLIAPLNVTLSPERAGILADMNKTVSTFGFEASTRGSVAEITAIPSLISADEAEETLIEALDIIAKENGGDLSVKDKIYHSVACKAAIKAGKKTSTEDVRFLVKELLKMPDIRYCPHGRPVMLIMKKQDFDSKFKR